MDLAEDVGIGAGVELPLPSREAGEEAPLCAQTVGGLFHSWSDEA